MDECMLVSQLLIGRTSVACRPLPRITLSAARMRGDVGHERGGDDRGDDTDQEEEGTITVLLQCIGYQRLRWTEYCTENGYGKWMMKRNPKGAVPWGIPNS